MSIDLTHYIKVTHAIVRPLCLKHNIDSVYIEKALWAQVVDINNIAPEGKQESLFVVLRILYLVESFVLATDYLPNNTFPIATPTSAKNVGHHIIEVAHTTQKIGVKKQVYLNWTGVSVSETNDLCKGNVCQFLSADNIRHIDSRYSEKMAIKMVAQYHKKPAFYVKRLLQLIANDIILGVEL